MTDAQSAALVSLLPQYSVDSQQSIAAGETNGFARPAPIWLEIGFGNGDMLLRLATLMPAINFIGAEVHRPGVGRLLHHMRANALTNIRVIMDDAVQFLTDQVADNTIERILLLFPDPWHKKRHHKRRIVNAEFAALLADKLIPGGVFHAATDWQDYAEHMLEVLNAHPQLVNLGGEAHYSPMPDYRIETRFERRGRALGHGVWDLLYRRRS